MEPEKVRPACQSWLALRFSSLGGLRQRCWRVGRGGDLAARFPGPRRLGSPLGCGPAGGSAGSGHRGPIGRGSAGNRPGRQRDRPQSGPLTGASARRRALVAGYLPRCDTSSAASEAMTGRLRAGLRQAHSDEPIRVGWPHGSGSLCRPANRSKSRSKLTRRQPLAIARAARWTSVQSRAGISPPRSSW